MLLGYSMKKTLKGLLLKIQNCNELHSTCGWKIANYKEIWAKIG